MSAATNTMRAAVADALGGPDVLAVRDDWRGDDLEIRGRDDPRQDDDHRRTWSTIGSANIDRLSLTGNYEVNVELFDRGVAEHLERVFATDLWNATRLTPAEWARRGILAKATERLLLAPCNHFSEGPQVQRS